MRAGWQEVPYRNLSWQGNGGAEAWDKPREGDQGLTALSMLSRVFSFLWFLS